MKKLTALLLLAVMLFSQASAETFGAIVRHGSREEKRLCITVDDCADSEMIQAIFDLSRREEIPLTYFTNGYTLKDEDKELWLTIAQSDCEIGNHCFSHYSLHKMKVSEIISQLTRCQERLDEVMGAHYPMQMMRPPFGNVTRYGSSWHVRNAVKKAGYAHIVKWDVSQNNAEKCLEEVKNGSILLFHTIQKDLNCLETIIPALKAEGWEFVTVSEMFGLEKPELVQFSE